MIGVSQRGVDWQAAITSAGDISERRKSMVMHPLKLGWQDLRTCCIIEPWAVVIQAARKAQLEKLARTEVVKDEGTSVQAD